jgi:hypothetical protein
MKARERASRAGNSATGIEVANTYASFLPNACPEIHVRHAKAFASAAAILVVAFACNATAQTWPTKRCASS